MAQPVIRYVGMDYFDRTGPLQDGSVQPEGLTLQCLPMGGGHFGGLDDWPDADAVEMSVSKYLSGLAQGDQRAIALPIYSVARLPPGRYLPPRRRRRERSTRPRRAPRRHLRL